MSAAEGKISNGGKPVNALVTPGPALKSPGFPNGILRDGRGSPPQGCLGDRSHRRLGGCDTRTYSLIKSKLRRNLFRQWATEIEYPMSAGTDPSGATAEIMQSHYEKLLTIDKLSWTCATCKRINNDDVDCCSLPVTVAEYPPSKWKRFKKAFSRTFWCSVRS